MRIVPNGGNYSSAHRICNHVAAQHSQIFVVANCPIMKADLPETRAGRVAKRIHLNRRLRFDAFHYVRKGSAFERDEPMKVIGHNNTSPSVRTRLMITFFERTNYATGHLEVDKQRIAISRCRRQQIRLAQQRHAACPQAFAMRHIVRHGRAFAAKAAPTSRLPVPSYCPTSA